MICVIGALLFLTMGCTFASPAGRTELPPLATRGPGLSGRSSGVGARLSKDEIIKLVADLKEQQLRILSLEGKVNISKEALAAIKNSNETTVGDLEYSPEQYQSIKKQLDEREKLLAKTGGRGRAASPDFQKVPQLRWSEMPIKCTTNQVSNPQARQAIDQSLAEIQSKSGGCVTFQKVASSPQGPHLAYLEERSYEGRSCGSSPLGKQPNGNALRIAPSCMDGRTLIHETMHSLGFDHTQNRPDRDQYLRINWGNIMSEYQHNFALWPNALKNQPTPYDYKSLMHYYSTAFATNSNMDTMTPLVNPAETRKYMGHVKELSELDVEALQKVYCAPGQAATPAPGSGGSGGSGGSNSNCRDRINSCSQMQSTICNLSTNSPYFIYSLLACGRTCGLCDTYSLKKNYACSDYKSICYKHVMSGECTSSWVARRARAHLMCPKMCGVCK